MVISITLVLAAITGFSLSESQARLRDEMLERAQGQLRVLVHAASVYAAQEDSHQLILTGQAATAGGQPQFITFYSPAGELLATAAAPSSPDTARAAFGDLPQLAQASGANQVRWTASHLELAEPIVYQGQQAGTIAIRLGLEELDENFRRELLRSSTISAILLIALVLVVGLLLRQFVIVPLRRLSAASDRISAGEWIAPPGQKRSDELGVLARSFGQMLKALQAREAQLQDQISAVQQLNNELDARVVERTHELHDLVEQQEQLLRQIRTMSTPVVPVLERVLIVPIVGSLDNERTDQLLQSVLSGVERQRARLVVLDITGVPVVDTEVARAIIQIASAARLLGCTTALVGTSPEVAQTLVQLGIDLTGLKTFATLQDALHTMALRTLHTN